MADEFTGNFADISRQEQPRKIPYWQVLDDYDKARQMEPELAKLSLQDFSQKMNEVTGSGQYDEGLHGGTLRTLAVTPERALRHFGAPLPGKQLWSPEKQFGIPTMSEMLGGPKEGIDIPEVARKFGESAATKMGAGPEMAKEIGGVTEGFPGMGLNLLVGGGLGGLPGVAAAFGLEKYGETGRVLPSAVAAGSAYLYPKWAQGAGQAVLKRMGAKTLGELKPEVMNLLDMAQPASKKYVEQLMPSGLAQRGAEFVGKQLGFLGAGEAAGIGETLVDEGTWQDKLGQVGHMFSPSGLAATATGQLPFTLFDLVGGFRHHPVKLAETAAQESFKARYTQQAMRGDPETGTPPFVPTPTEVEAAMKGAMTGKIDPKSKTAQVLKSMGNLPYVQDLATPVITSTEAWPMPQAIKSVQERAQMMLEIRGDAGKIDDSYQPATYSILRAVETDTKGRANKEDVTHMAATRLADQYQQDQKDLEILGKPSQPIKEGDVSWEDPFTGEQGMSKLKHTELFTEINDKIDPKSPNYDPDLAARVALVIGDQEHLRQLGIEHPITYNTTGGTERVPTTLGGPEAAPLEVSRRTLRQQPLTRSIIDLFSGMGPKPTLNPDIVDRQRELFRLDRELRDLEGVETQTPEQMERIVQLGTRMDELKKQVKKLQSELGTRQRGFRATGGGLPTLQGALQASTTAEAVRRALTYGKTKGDERKGLSLTREELKDPAKVAEFIANVSQAMKRAELGATRDRAGSRWLPERPNETEESANMYADQLNEEAQKLEGEWGLRYRPALRRDKWRVVEEKYDRTQPFTDEKPGIESEEAQEAEFREQMQRELSEQLGEMGMEAPAKEPAAPTLADYNIDVQEVADNFYSKRLDELDRLTDKAEAFARRDALARNVIYYLHQIPESEFKSLILGHVKAEQGMVPSSIRSIDKLKQRMIKYVQYLRMGGRVDTAIEKHKPYKAEQVQIERRGGGERLLREPIPLEKQELGGPRLVATDKDQLVLLEKWMGGGTEEGGYGFGKYPATHERAGEVRADDWNRGKVGSIKVKDEKTGKEVTVYGGLNFFEQFGVLMNDLKKYLPDPKAFTDAYEHRPLGDFGGVPAKFVDYALDNLVVKWQPDLMGIGFRMPAGTAAGFAVTGKPYFFEVRDREGKEITLSGQKLDPETGKFVTANPLFTFFTQGARHNYSMPLGQLLDMYEKFGNLTSPSDRAMLALAKKLAGNSAFVRNTPVGVGIARDPRDKAYYHTDRWASSAGIFASPFKEVDVTTPELIKGIYPNEFWTRELMTPAEIFPHIMNEVGHTAVDFAYIRDAPFQKEVNRIFAYVQEHLEMEKIRTGGQSDWVKENLHSLTNPREFLAGIFNDGRLHQLLSEIPDPFEPLPALTPGVGAVASLFDRIRIAIRGMLTRLFGIGEADGNKLLNRMAELGARGFETQQNYNLKHRGDIFHEAVLSNLIPGGKRRFGGILERPEKRPGMIVHPGLGPAVKVPEKVSVERPPWWFIGPRESWRFYETLPPELVTDVPKTRPGASIFSAIKNHESMWADAKAKLQTATVAGDEAGVAQAQEELKTAQVALSSLYRMRMQQWEKVGGMYGPSSWQEARKFPPEPSKPPPEKPGVMTVMPTGEVLQGQAMEPGPYGGQITADVGQQMREAMGGGEILKSRLVPEEDPRTEISRPVFNIQGRKGTLLRDPLVNQIVTTAVAGRRVIDNFSGGAQLTTFSKNAGAEHVTLNVFNPEHYSIFNQIKSNTAGFSRKVKNVASLIDSRRNQIPRMRDGSDLRTTLNQVQARDQDVGLFLKQNLSYFGREVGKEGKFTPQAAITNAGLADLPRRIRETAKAVDELKQGDGWVSVANTQPSEVGLVDPVYVGERGRYGEPPITPEQRVAEYEKYMYPAAERGANFVVFDAAHPLLMQSLAAHGFTVQPVQRTGRTGRAVRQEFIAYNHEGEMLPSRVDGQKVFETLRSAAPYLMDDPTRTWFRPYNLAYFRDTFGPVFGSKLQLEVRGNVLGYSLSHSAINGVTPNDLARMPKPIVKPWAPSLFESLRSLFVNDGSSKQTSEAIASQMLQYGALLRNTEGVLWNVAPKQVENQRETLASTWGYTRKVDLYPGAVGTSSESLPRTLMHESAHTAGFHDFPAMEAPDVQAAVKRVNDMFFALSDGERRTFLQTLSQISEHEGEPVYPVALTDPTEFAAEFLGHVGERIANVPNPSAYLKEEMRFVPDEMSRMLVNVTLRRTQGLIGLKRTIENISRTRGLNNDALQKTVNDMIEAFKPLARSALDISNDQSNFYILRNLFPDMYEPMLNKWAQESTETFMKKEPPAVAEGEILKSREPINTTIRKFFHFADPEGKLPRPMSWWDKWLTQFPQLAQKYPQLRSAWDMFFNARAIFNNYKTKVSTALAGAYQGDKFTDDARTKHVAAFQKRPDLREAFSKTALEINFYGDKIFDAQLKEKGDIMAMTPEATTGWLTSDRIKATLKKYGVADKDIPMMMTVMDGTRAQVKVTSAAILGSALHRMEIATAVAVARNTDLSPEASRSAAKLLTDAVMTAQSSPVASADKAMQFQQLIKDPVAYEKIFDATVTAWEGARKLARFLELRMPYFMSERRPGTYGLFFEGKDGKVESRYFKDDADRREYMIKHNIDPNSRQTNPGDRNYGVDPQVFKQLDDVQTRTKEKLVSMFGPEQGAELAAVMDMATDLRNALNSRDILRATTGRKLAPGREELDMFQAHQQYVSSVGRAAYNTFVRLEAELVNTSSDFINRPDLKEYINRQVKMVMVPDSPIGRMAQNLGFFYYLFANPSSMMMQASDQLMGLAPMLTARGGSVAGAFNTLKNANLAFLESRRKGKYADPEIQAAVDRAKRDGSISSWIAQEMRYDQDFSLVNRMRATEGKGLWTPFDMLKTKLYQGFDLLRRMYDIIPHYNSEVALVASLMHLRNPKAGGFKGEELYREAQFLRATAMFTGGKEGRPGYFQVVPRSAAQALWSLQTYVNGLTTMMGEMIRKSVSPKGAGLSPAQATQVRKAAAQMLITQVAVAGTFGLPFGQAILYGLQKLFPEHNFEQDVREVLASLFGDDENMGQLFSTGVVEGVPSALNWVPDLNSRFALAGVFNVSPYSGVGWEQLVGPSGGVMSRVLQGIQAGTRGDPMQTVQSLMPIGFQRLWKALEQGHTYQTQAGETLATDLRPEEIVARALGFGLSRVAKLQRYERLSRLSVDAEKAALTRWTREQVKLMMGGQDAQVQQNIAKKVADTGGVYPAVQLSNDISREYERETMPTDMRAFGNRATARAQKSLRAVLGTQYEGPSNVERLQLQQSIAQRLGLGGPSRGSLLHAAQRDQLLSLYPHLNNAQADLLMTHAFARRPSPDLYQELLDEYQ